MQKQQDDLNGFAIETEISCLILAVLFVLYITRRHNAVLKHRDAVASILAARYTIVMTIGAIMLVHHSLYAVMLHRSVSDNSLRTGTDGTFGRRFLYLRFAAECILFAGFLDRMKSIPTSGPLGILACCHIAIAAVSCSAVIRRQMQEQRCAVAGGDLKRTEEQ